MKFPCLPVERIAVVGLVALFAACGSTTSPGPSIPSIQAFTASPPSIQAGQSSTLSWSVTGATAVSISPGVGTVTGTSVSVSPTSTTSYTLTATNASGSITATLAVTVGSAAGPTIQSFVASPPSIQGGQSSTLSWSVTGATSVSIDQGLGTVAGTSVSVSPTSTTAYTLTATNASGSSTATVTVTVTATGSSPSIQAFTSSPSSIQSGQSATLSWSVTGATSLSISPGVGTVAGISVSVSPTSTTAYTLTATNAFGSSTATVTVTITVSQPSIQTFTASPSSIQSGQSATLSWSVTGATSLSIGPGVGTVTGTSVSVSPASTTSYTLTATNASGSVTATTVVNVIPAGLAACVLTRSSSTTVSIASTHPRVLLSDASYRTCLQQMLAAPTASATRFKGLVDSQLAGGNAYAFEPWFAALMFQLTGSTTYADYAVSRTEAFVASEEALIAANQRATVAADSYLEVGPIIGNVMLVYDWCYDRLTPAQRSRWVAYANQAVWNVWHPDEARWGNTVYAWSGWSIDNPSNNYYYSFLQATMMVGLASFGENPQAPTWIDQFRTVKLENQLFPTFNRDLVGGGSREGTGYGTAMKNLFELYEWWERSTTERIANRTPHTLASMAHTMHSIVPTLDRLAPTGDHARDSTAELFDYHRQYLQTLMALFPGERLAGTAKSLLAASSVPRMQFSFMYYSDFLYENPNLVATPLADLATTYWGSGTGQLPMRSAWNTSSAYANFICGPYTESHAHRDQGSFVLHKGTWLAYDANIDSASGIEQDEVMHSLVRIVQGGSVVTQVEGAPQCNLLAMGDDVRITYALADVTPIYNGKAAVAKVEREFLFLKPDAFVVFDRADTVGAGVQRVWTLNVPATPTVAGDRLTLTQGANRMDVFRAAPTGLSYVVSGHRVDVADSAGTGSQFLHVFGLDGSVASVARSDAAGQTGVEITFADGRSATVRFSIAGRGGTLELRAAGGASLFSGALPTTVATLPLFAN